MKTTTKMSEYGSKYTWNVIQKGFTFEWSITDDNDHRFNKPEHETYTPL